MKQEMQRLIITVSLLGLDSKLSTMCLVMDKRFLVCNCESFLITSFFYGYLLVGSLVALLIVCANQYSMNIYKKKDVVVEEQLFPKMMYIMYLALFGFVVSNYAKSPTLRYKKTIELEIHTVLFL